MSEIGRVSELWRYPASSLAGERLDEIAIGADGLAGDRMFGVIDTATGEPGRPDRDRKWRRLPLIRARLAGGRLEAAVPGGGWLSAPGDECDGALTEFVGFPVSLLPFSREAAPGFSGAADVIALQGVAHPPIDHGLACAT